MDQNDIHLDFVSFTMVYPPLPRFPSGSAAQFFAKVQGPHDFESFEQQSDVSATLATEARRRLEISRNEMKFEATVSSHLDLLRQEVSSLIAEVLSHFGIRTFILPSVTMRAVWQAPPESNLVVDFLQDRVNITEEQKALLGDVSAVSMTFAGSSDPADDPGHRHWDVEIAPYFRDPDGRSVWIESVMQFFAPNNTPDSVDESLNVCYSFLRGNVVPFLNDVFKSESG